jgi:hypothetical protein
LSTADSIFSTDILIKLAGDVIFQRGRYQSLGRVLYGKIDQENFCITGDIVGSGNRVYSARVQLYNKSYGYVCKWPYETFCKHLVALILDVKERYVSHDTKKVSQPNTAIYWAEASTSHQPQNKPSLELELMFSLRTAQENKRKLRAGHRLIDERPQLLCSIVKKAAREQWLKSAPIWENIRNSKSFYYDYGADSDPVIINALLDIKSLYQTSVSTKWQNMPKWIDLNLIPSHFLFEVLFAARLSGIAFVYNCPMQLPVELISESFTPTAQFEKDHRGNIILELQIKNKKRILDMSRAIVLGAAGTALFHWQGDISNPESLKNINISPICPHLDQKYHSPAQSGLNLIIPRDELALFIQNELPMLEDSFEISVIDDALKILEISGPFLKIAVKQLSPDHISLSFSWIYYTDGHPIEHGLMLTRENFKLRDLKRERIITDKILDYFCDFPTFQDASSLFEQVELVGMECYEFVNIYNYGLKNDEDIIVDLLTDLLNYEYLFGDLEFTIAAETSNDIDWLDLSVSLKIDGIEIPYSELYPALVNG